MWCISEHSSQYTTFQSRVALTFGCKARAPPPLPSACMPPSSWAGAPELDAAATDCERSGLAEQSKMGTAGS